MHSRRFETGPGFLMAVPCPDCGHTRCGRECPCTGADQPAPPRETRRCERCGLVLTIDPEQTWCVPCALAEIVDVDAHGQVRS